MLSRWHLSIKNLFIPISPKAAFHVVVKYSIICRIKDNIWITVDYFNIQVFVQPWFTYKFELLSAKELPCRTHELRLPSCLKILKEQDVHDFLSLIWLRLQLLSLGPLVKSNFNSCLGLLACWTDFILLICSDSKTKLLKAIFSAPTKGTLYKNMT